MVHAGRDLCFTLGELPTPIEKQLRGWLPVPCSQNAIEDVEWSKKDSPNPQASKKERHEEEGACAWAA